MSRYLTPNFSLAEMTATSHRNYDNTPPSEVMANLVRTCEVHEKIRAHLCAQVPGTQILGTSGYRCPAVNCLVGGAMTRQSLLALLDVSPDQIVSITIQMRLSQRKYGSQDSAHMLGLALDSVSPRYGTPLDVCRAIAPNVEAWGIDQLIYEHDWTHVGLSLGEPRHQVMTLMPNGSYQFGIHPKAPR